MSDDDRLHRLVTALQQPALFDHPVSGFTTVETHISVVLLTGPFAYKFKKPVDLGFCDFSTLELRRQACEDEVRLNRRLAGDMYVGVVAITGSGEAPRPGGDGTPIEYAVKMVQFDPDEQLDRVLARGGLKPQHLDEAALRIGEFHAGAGQATGDAPWGTADLVYEQIMDNFPAIEPCLGRRRQMLAALRDSVESELDGTVEAITRRRAGGHVRECHGDLHLANMALHEGRVLVFDCIEFNESLRWIDVAADTAFAVMDLHDRGQPALARRFLDRWLEALGDYGALEVLPLYMAYRALVRAKIACIRLGQHDLDEADQARARDDLHGYLALAGHMLERRRHPPLLITHGLSASGKSTVAAAVVEELGAVRLRSDVERKRLHGMAAAEHAPAEPGQGLYAPGVTEQVYEHLLGLARTCLGAGFPVVVDATFLAREQRRPFGELAAALGVPWWILDVTAPEEELRRRIVARQQRSGEPSDATLAVLDAQIRAREPLDTEERSRAVEIRSGDSAEVARIVRDLI